MLREIKIKSKITALLISVVVATVLVISMVAYHLSINSITGSYRENLVLATRLKAEQINLIFKQLEQNMRLIQSSPRVVDCASRSILMNNSNRDTLLSGIKKQLDVHFANFQTTFNYRNMVMLDRDGKIIFKTNGLTDRYVLGERFPHSEAFVGNIAQEVFYGEIFKTNTNDVHMNVTVALQESKATSAVGYVVVEFDLAQIYQIIEDNSLEAIGTSCEVVIGKLSNSKIVCLNKLAKSNIAALSQHIVMGDNRLKGLQGAVKGMEDSGYDTDHQDTKVLAAWQQIPLVKWGVLVKINRVEIGEKTNDLVRAFIISGVIIVLVSFFVSTGFSNVLIKPLLSLKQALNVVANGELPIRVVKTTNDEIGEMAVAVNHLVQALRTTADFARRIGEEDYTADFKPISQKDVLGNALIGMRDSIAQADTKDRERNWIVSGVAEIGQILRERNDISGLGDSIVSFICQKIEAVQGAFYVANENEQGQTILEMKACYAFNKKKYISTSFKFAEGLVGQCAIEKDLILRTEIPATYPQITSGILGDRTPTSLLLVPLINEDKVYGVLEFAGFDKFLPMHINFTREIGVIIARTIYNIKINERTVHLLKESQQMSMELQDQQEILRQNAEEMEATQEELRRSNTQLEEQILEVNRTQKRMQVVLENASEIVTIYEIDRTIRYISPSVESILGYTQEELIGLNDISHVHEESKAIYDNFFVRLLEDKEHKITIQFEYYKKSNETVWLEATGANRTEDAAVRGLVVNMRDITERRLAEKESRMRGQMQSLSENSPDLIMRVNSQGTIFYINPVIESLTGYPADALLNQSLGSTPINSDLVAQWLNILSSVLQSKQTSTQEMELASLEGVRIMQVNAIPEQNDNQEIESVLIVSHDITQQKLIETTIRETNKKISESINYAKRIQTAILPNSDVLSNVFPHSFIYYKPRDIVSGDFPWFMQKGQDVCIAAVDCTGHGVPGALISLIGYFVLNNVVSLSEYLHSGEILDLLDEGVRKTLRQDTEATTKDGMDIALLKINLSTNLCEFSGSHRPLYWVCDGQLEHIKGDKCPVGGSAHYKNKTKFTTHTLQLKHGDRLFVFSDGLPDQFGGVNNKKYSSRRIREMIMANNSSSMEETQFLIQEDLTTWMGDHKQTDDILMIGIQV
ncbi:MAG: PAS domain S-box protein [Cytophagales bacterium]|nr:MAG: PAS domain S-box protein [Cytophagales bacterium]TAF59654.1 MAG: PAS domain S-box protein [Cytophagales bacterium]